MSKILNNFLTALTFMSRIPFRLKKVSALKLNYFPLVGLLLALILIGVNYLLFFLFPLAIRTVLLLILYVYLTGALHLDGLGDFADGFFAGRDQEKTAEIMHDSNTGIFALVTLILVLGLKYLLFKEILANSSELLIIMAVLPRYILGFLIVFFETGDSSLFAKFLKEDSQPKDLIYSSLIFVIILFLYFQLRGLNFIYPLFLSLVFISALIFYLKGWSDKKLGGFTGDLYGTVIEISELIFLLTVISF